MKLIEAELAGCMKLLLDQLKAKGIELDAPKTYYSDDNKYKTMTSRPLQMFGKGDVVYITIGFNPSSEEVPNTDICREILKLLNFEEATEYDVDKMRELIGSPLTLEPGSRRFLFGIDKYL